MTSQVKHYGGFNDQDPEVYLGFIGSSPRVSEKIAAQGFQPRIEFAAMRSRHRQDAGCVGFYEGRMWTMKRRCHTVEG